MATISDEDAVVVSKYCLINDGLSVSKDDIKILASLYQINISEDVAQPLRQMMIELGKTMLKEKKVKLLKEKNIKMTDVEFNYE